MKWLNITRNATLPEDVTLGARLEAITDRGRAEVDSYPVHSLAEEPPATQLARRSFSTAEQPAGQQ